MSIEKEFVTVVCKDCAHEAIIFGVIRFFNEDEYRNVVEIWQQGTWNYCPYCGVKNENPRGMNGEQETK